MTKLILIRHGETETNAQGITHKFKDDAHLTQTGINQIQETAIKLKEIGVQKLYSSNEARSIESANIIKTQCNIPMEVVTDLEERNWGELSGKPWSEIQAILDKLTLQERYEYIPPKGESWRNFENRLGSALKKILENNANKNIAIVTHGGAIRALVPILLGLPKEESFKYDPKNGEMFVFDIDKSLLIPN